MDVKFQNIMKKVYYSGCIIEISEGKYIFQLRDNKSEISKPNVISVFGGRLKEEESFLSAIKRELFEELSIVVHESNLHFIGYIEIFDEHKKHVVGCTCYYTKYFHEITQCNEGEPVILSKDDIISNDSVEPVTKELYSRLLFRKMLNDNF